MEKKNTSQASVNTREEQNPHETLTEDGGLLVVEVTQM